MKSSDRPTRFKHRSIFFLIAQTLKKTRLKMGGGTILKGVTIGDNCIVAANSVVVGNSTFPDSCVIAGNPAKIVKMLK